MDNPRDHFDWAVARATAFIKAGDAIGAYGSITSDLAKNPVTADILTTKELARGMDAAGVGAAAVRRWIEALPAPREEIWKVETCVACHWPIIWANSEKGDPMPVDAEPPTRGGDIQLRRGPTGVPLAVVLTVMQQFGKYGLRTRHMKTCPKRDVFRRRAIERRINQGDPA